MTKPIDEWTQADLDNRFSYHPPKNAATQEKYRQIRALGKMLAELYVRHCPDGRERALALTNLEQSNMWANAAIARSEE